MQTDHELVAGYIEELAIEMAKMARRDGMHALAFVLEMAAAEAGDNKRQAFIRRPSSAHDKRGDA
jgi:hypothetical protein